MKISIHQPNFMPWYPFFKKIEEAEVFVILSQCQYEKGGFQNRFNMNDRWYTMSVNRGMHNISTKQYINEVKDWDNIKRKLPEYQKVLDEFDDCIQKSLMHTNIDIIKKICSFLNIKTKIVYDKETDQKGTDRLLEICKLHNAETYIAGPSGRKYLDERKFLDNNIKVIYQNQKEKDKVPILKVL
jgi:hypothetical protein